MFIISCLHDGILVGRSSPLFDTEKESTGIDNEKGREEGEKQDGE